MKTILGLFALGLVVVIIVQFAKAGSKGPTVVSNLFSNVTGYISLLK